MGKRRPFMLYHWSPVERRKSILHDGLCPGKKANLVGNDPAPDGWRAPYVCFSRFPTVAWAMSATHTDREGLWDLWLTWSDAEEYKTLTVDSTRWTYTEYRIYRRIPKSKIWYVGTREFVPRKRK